MRLPSLPPLRRSVGDSLAFIAGATMVRVSLSGQHRMFVKPSMGRWLIATGTLLALASAWRILSANDKGKGAANESADHESADHDHAHGGTWVAMLMLLPIIALFAVKPGSLGSFAAGRSASVVSASVDIEFVPLNVDGLGSAEITLNDVWSRAINDKTKSLTRQPIRMTGFVVPDKASTANVPTFLLTRFKIACCAADGIPIQIRIDSRAAAVLPTETWVEVTGVFVGMKDKVPYVRLTDIRRVNEPSDPYE